MGPWSKTAARDARTLASYKIESRSLASCSPRSLTVLSCEARSRRRMRRASSRISCAGKCQTFYNEACVYCHGAPGKNPTDIGRRNGIPSRPKFPYRWGWAGRAANCSWIAKHGIRMTGMPAFGSTTGMKKIWKVVAFVQRLTDGDRGGVRQDGAPRRGSTRSLRSQTERPLLSGGSERNLGAVIGSWDRKQNNAQMVSGKPKARPCTTAARPLRIERSRTLGPVNAAHPLLRYFLLAARPQSARLCTLGKALLGGQMWRRGSLRVRRARRRWPLNARAQQAERVRRVGVLMNRPRTIPKDRPASQRSCRGCSNWAGPKAATYGLISLGSWQRCDIRKNAAELVALAPDVIFASGSAAVGPVLQATRTVPIVFVVVADPVGAGFVDSLARPGGNVTGFAAGRIQHEREMAGTT